MLEPFAVQGIPSCLEGILVQGARPQLVRGTLHQTRAPGQKEFTRWTLFKEKKHNTVM